MKIILICISMIALTMWGCEQSSKRQEQYAVEHNCRYDYNGLCYTEEERPWLFGGANND